MHLQTISQVSRDLGISTRMLRYYEQIGLVKSLRKEDYSYRVYDETALERLRMIILLRKLRIPVRQICEVLNDQDIAAAITVFQQNIDALSTEINNLSAIRSILERFVGVLREKAHIVLKPELFCEASILAMTTSLSFCKNYIKEEQSMEDLIRVDESPGQLQDVRLVYLPPMTVASSHYVGEDSEGNAARPLNKFVLESGLLKIKPDVRHFGFNNSLERAGIGEPSPGYEMWVSIPDDMAVPPPLVKKKFHGGLYAAHMIKMGDFDHWLSLQEWVSDSEDYTSDLDSVHSSPSMDGMDPCLEEQLNYFSNVQNPAFVSSAMQLDLLFPVKPAQAVAEAAYDIEGSEDRCGFKARLFTKSKFSILGFTKIITPELGDGAVQDFWKETQADGRLDTILKYKNPGAPVLGLSSADSESRKAGGWRYTICLSDADITDATAFKAHRPYIRKIDASRWICYDMTKAAFFERFWKENPHAVTQKLGYAFNGPISGHFDVFPEGITRIYDKNDSKDAAGSIRFWMPVK
jgi:DNA-binding transcriptional MerR regulator